MIVTALDGVITVAVFFLSSLNSSVTLSFLYGCRVCQDTWPQWDQRWLFCRRWDGWVSIPSSLVSSSHLSPALCIFGHKGVQICLLYILFFERYQFPGLPNLLIWWKRTWKCNPHRHENGRTGKLIKSEIFTAPCSSLLSKLFYCWCLYLSLFLLSQAIMFKLWVGNLGLQCINL